VIFFEKLMLPKIENRRTASAVAQVKMVEKYDTREALAAGTN